MIEIFNKKRDRFHCVVAEMVEFWKKSISQLHEFTIPDIFVDWKKNNFVKTVKFEIGRKNTVGNHVQLKGKEKKSFTKQREAT